MTSDQAPRIAVLSKKDPAVVHFDKWLAGLDFDLFVDHAQSARCDSRENCAARTITTFPNWRTNHAVELAVADSHADRRYDAIVALSECDIERAGLLRSSLGIPGQSQTSAVAYRDKLVMKNYASDAGLSVPAYRAVDSPLELTSFFERYGPCVVKPRGGAGSAGVAVLSDRRSLDRYIAQTSRNLDTPPRLLAEEYVDSPMIVIDGITDGADLLVWTASLHRGSCLDVVRTNSPVAVVHIDDDHPLAQTGVQYCRELIRVLPSPDCPVSFHCELFMDPRTGPRLCEIASRTGGSGVRWAFQQRTGVDLDEAACRGQAGLGFRPPPSERSAFAGYVHIPRKTGRVARAPRECPIDGTCGVVADVSRGQVTTASSKVSELAAIVRIRTRSAEEAMTAARDALVWAGDSFRWVDDVGQG